MKIKEYVEDCHQNAINKGFYDSTERALLAVEGDIDLSYEVYHAEIAKRLMLITGEIGEACEADRKGKYGLEQKDTFEDELADAVIRIFDLCGWMEIDLEKQIK